MKKTYILILLVLALGLSFNTYRASAADTLVFSQNNITLGFDESIAVQVTNSSTSPISVTSNSNPAAIHTIVFGNTINIYAADSGAAVIMVCDSNSQCGSLSVTVKTTDGLNQVGLSQSDVTINLQGTAQVSAYSSSNVPLYISTNSNPAAVAAQISSNVISLKGTSAGQSKLVICGLVTTACAELSVKVNDGTVLGAAIYKNGTLINDSGTIYITYKNSKTPFANLAAFLGLGFKLKNVISASAGTFDNSNFIIGTSNMPHPRGSWIINGLTIYFVSDQGLIPIPTYDIFLNNGGTNQFVVKSNNFDLALPILSVMDYSDTRLR